MGETMMNIWRFQKVLTLRLAAWAGVSVLLGSLLSLLGSPLWKGVGAQFAGWGLVNGAIAFFGSQSADRRQSALPDPFDPHLQQQEAAKLERLLWINTALDVFYMAGGALLASSKGRKDRLAAGHGFGILAQGAFLFLFDWLHAGALRRSGISRRDIIL
jgi:hypothetical protein